MGKLVNGMYLDSCGVDNICIDVLNNKECKMVLYRLYNVCFVSGRVPEQWLKRYHDPCPKSIVKKAHSSL